MICHAFFFGSGYAAVKKFPHSDNGGILCGKPRYSTGRVMSSTTYF